ncbi:Retrotransposon Pao, partial [Trinorchestia longiramus]
YPEAQRFILNSFYVDDGLGSAETPEQTIQILTGARSILERYKIRLHKIVSSSDEVMRAFPSSELAEDTEIVDLDHAPLHRSLGVFWDIKRDLLIIKPDLEEKPFTRRGVLSFVNAIFDPLGVACPVVLRGKLIQRKESSNDKDKKAKKASWDKPLPVKYKPLWDDWIKSLRQAPQIAVPRSYRPLGFGKCAQPTLHVFCDASKEAIGHAIYLRSVNTDGKVQVSFVTGSSKVSPRSATSVPRLELCVAVDASRAHCEVLEELQMSVEATTFYTDSLIVMGYLSNKSKRFSRYVSRRVQMILSASSASQWTYVPTDKNPADIATRPISPVDLGESIWLTGPDFL